MPLSSTFPQLWFEHAGDDGSPVLLIMGLGMRGVVWQPQVDGLRGRHRVAWFDNRGIARSDAARGFFSIAEMAGDALRVMDALGWKQAHVVGVSMGGMIAQETALLAPERCLSLTLIATHAGGMRAIVPTVEGLVHFARAQWGPPAERVNALPRLLYTPEFLASVDVAALQQRMAAMVGVRASREVLRAQLVAVARHRTADRLHRLTAPTLVVQPARDLLIRPDNSTVLHRCIRGARLARFDDAGHGVTYQCADRLNGLLLEHLAAVDTSAERAVRANAPGCAIPT